MGKRRNAGIYARISLDRKDGEGVARQLADCRTLAAERGWEVVGEYVDNDLSAFRAKRRPEWDRLLEDLKAGTVDALVAYHPDRTYRKASDLEALIDAVEATGAEVATVKAGDIDLATATGRMGARIVAAVSRHESERIGERVSRAKRERAAQGRPPGGGFRAFGWENDKITLVPTEAAALAAAASRVAAGGSYGREVAELNEQGFVTTGGRPWTTTALRRVLTSPRIAGLREYGGKIVGPAAWPAIIDEDTWRLLCVMSEGRRRGRNTSGRWLLSALIQCPKCDGTLYAHPPAYGCHPSTRGGCGGASISIAAADGAVTSAVSDYLHDPHVPAWVGQGAKPVDLTAELAALEQKGVDLARRWALDEMTLEAYDAARAVLDRRMDALGEVAPPSARVPDLDRIRAAWEDGDTIDRRGVVQALLVVPIELKPGRMANPGDRLAIQFRS